VDDVVLANGTQYSVEKGSTVITLKSDYLKTLSEGEHTITVNFKDGTVTASFNNLKRDAESIPATGETAIKATVGVVLVLAAVSGLAVVLIKRKKKSEK
jgi:LPXTG-motif cell wall-anchored protein